VAREGTMTAAAAALAYTPSAVSQAIGALEREAGTQLVQRGPRGVRLTEAGAVLARHAAALRERLALASTTWPTSRACAPAASGWPPSRAPAPCSCRPPSRRSARRIPTSS
jgi:DNA-binding transcriptional LysR family regulator